MVSFLFLASSSIFASDHISNVSVTVPVSCNITSTLNTAHTATINPGQYKENIGTTTFKVFCNDNTGYAIYAIGYSGDEYGNTNMLPTNPSTSTNPSIATGTAISGNTSNWSMKLNYVDGTYKPTIESDTNGSFANYHIVPDTYTKVATLTTNTDFTIGSSFQSTYRVFVSQTQPADTYTGKVKYTVVHPHTEPAPILPHETAELMEGLCWEIKVDGWCGESDGTGEYVNDTKINALKMADSLPEGFVEYEDYYNIASGDSYNPIYTWFDDTNNTGIRYFYTPAKKIYMNKDSSFMFINFSALTDISALADWDTSSVINMSYMFYGTTSLTNIDALKDWDTSSVTSMYGMFTVASSLTNIDALKDWDTSSVASMQGMFAGASSLTDISGARNWNTGNVTDIGSMFSIVNNIDATVLNDWNVSKVTNKAGAFTCPADKRPSWY